MEKKALKESPVIFDQEAHEYTLNGIRLSGITPIISWMFPDTYKGIPQSVLDRAAEYGSMIHAKIELADSMGIVDDQCVRDYMELKDQKGLKTMCNEYLVSDERHVASSIDIVFEDDSLADIKTTSKVHIPNVTLQLSFYAWLYEVMNPGRKVPRIFCIWLPKPQYGEADIIELERVPASICEKIVEAYCEGGDPLTCVSWLGGCGFVWNDGKQRAEGEVPDGMQGLVEELMTVKKQLDILTEREKEIKGLLMDAMKARGEDKWQNDLIQVVKRAASERVSIDSKMLQKAHPDVWEECKKVTKVSESLTYKIL